MGHLLQRAFSRTTVARRAWQKELAKVQGWEGESLVIICIISFSRGLQKEAPLGTVT